MNIGSVLALLVVVVGIPLNVFVTARLWLIYRSNPKIAVLRERAIVALFVLVVVVVFGIVFISNDQPTPPLNPAETRILTRLAVLLVAVVPAGYWLWVYRRD